MDLLPQFQQPRGALALLADHGGFVHEQAVILHQAAVNRRGRFDILHDPAVPGKVGVKPLVEAPVEPQRVVAIRAGIAHGIGIVGGELVKEPPFRNVLKRRQLIAQQLRHQLFQTAVGKRSEFKRGLERHLRGGDGVIARRLHDDAQRIEKHGFKGQVVCDLDHRRIHPQRVAQEWDDLYRVGVRPAQVAQRHIDGAALGHGQRDADDVRAVRVQRGFVVVAVCGQRSRLKVEGHHACAAQVFFDLLQICFAAVIHGNAPFGWPEGRRPPSGAPVYASGGKISPVSGSTASALTASAS